MSRRSRRETKPAKQSIPVSVLAGLTSLVEGNEDLIREMLSAAADDSLVDKLTECMGMNALSAEMLLARFFDASVLSPYCISRLGKSGKGGDATLASRIAREWAKPTFQPLGGAPEAPEPNQEVDEIADLDEESTAAVAEEGSRDKCGGESERKKRKKEKKRKRDKKEIRKKDKKKKRDQKKREKHGSDRNSDEEFVAPVAPESMQASEGDSVQPQQHFAGIQAGNMSITQHVGSDSKTEDNEQADGTKLEGAGSAIDAWLRPHCM
jgi:hypothetical protein